MRHIDLVNILNLSNLIAYDKIKIPVPKNYLKLINTEMLMLFWVKTMSNTGVSCSITINHAFHVLPL